MLAFLGRLLHAVAESLLRKLINNTREEHSTDRDRATGRALFAQPQEGGH